MKKSAVVVSAAVVVAAVAAALYFGPHWTVHRMRVALDARDAQALSQYVDYPAVRESFKTQLMQALGRIPGLGAMQDNPFAALGKALAGGVVNQTVDALVTPDSVMAMLEHGQPSIDSPSAPSAPAAGGAPSTDTPPKAEDKGPRYVIEYVDYATVRIRAKDGTPGAFLMRRDGVFGWKLSGVELPPLN